MQIIGPLQTKIKKLIAVNIAHSVTTKLQVAIELPADQLPGPLSNWVIEDDFMLLPKYTAQIYHYADVVDMQKSIDW